MSNQQKAVFFLLSGLIMLLGTVGGIEQCLDLATFDGVYLAAFALVGLAFLALGASYANDGTNETLDKLL
jgi:hypothetical protein